MGKTASDIRKKDALTGSVTYFTGQKKQVELPLITRRRRTRELVLLVLHLSDFSLQPV